MGKSDGPSYDYVVYIDESGEAGLTKVRPIDKNGSSEWLIVSGVVIHAKDENNTENWLDEMRRHFVKFKAADIHFSRLTEQNKRIACRYMATRPMQIFTVCSNKKNMKGYDNPFAATRSLDNNWFYCWLTRVLLERITYFVKAHSNNKFGEPRRVKLVFSTRGGLSYSQMKAYFHLLRLQGGVGGLHLESGQVYFDVIDQRLVEIVPHFALSGLKFPDIAASSFFKGSDIYQTNECNPEFAKILKPRIANLQYQAAEELEAYTTFAGFGVKLLPSLKGAKITREQQELYRFYGYPRQWWDPTPPTSSPYRLATVVNRSIERPE